MTEDRESIRSFVVQELAKSDKPAVDAAIDWVVDSIQENRRKEAEEKKQQEERARHLKALEEDRHSQKNVAIIASLLVGAMFGSAIATQYYGVVLFVGGLTILAVGPKYARRALESVGWLGIVGSVLTVGGVVWTIYSLGDQRFSIAESILSGMGVWALGLFMFVRGMNRQEAKRATRQS